jgi:hypothetical protein
MKGPGRIVLVCLIMVFFLALPVYSNPIDPVYFDYIFLQNNTPISQPIEFTINCYGISTDNKNKNIATNEPELRYSWSRNCTLMNITGQFEWAYAHCYNDIDYDQLFEKTSVLNISSCDVEGNYSGKPFLLKHFSKDLTSSCVYYYLDYSGANQRYAISLNEYMECRTLDVENYTQYYQRCYKTLVNITSKDIASNQCFKEAQEVSKKSRCIEFHSRLANYSEYDHIPYTKYCKIELDLPYDNPFRINSDNSSTLRESPVESLYCSIISIFGSRC